MGKYSGKIGFATTVEVEPGVCEDTIVEKLYYGEFYTPSRRTDAQLESSNDKPKIQNEISVICDPFAENHLNDMRYIMFYGKRYKTSDIRVNRPRLNISLGEEYNGPVPNESN